MTASASNGDETSNQPPSRPIRPTGLNSVPNGLGTCEQPKLWRNAVRWGLSMFSSMMNLEWYLADRALSYAAPSPHPKRHARQEDHTPTGYRLT